jgi:hypothetical protein
MSSVFSWAWSVVRAAIDLSNQVKVLQSEIQSLKDELEVEKVWHRHWVEAKDEIFQALEEQGE